MTRYRRFVFVANTTTSDPIYLELSDAVLERIEDAIKPLGLASASDFALLAVLWALRSIEDGDRLTMLGLDES